MKTMLAKYYFPPILLQQSVRWGKGHQTILMLIRIAFLLSTVLQEDLYKWADSAEQDQDSPHALWESCYMAISACNEVLKVIEDAGNPASLSAEKGEALVCRAYAHFLLANIFCNAYSSQASSDLGIPYMKTIETP